MSSSSLFLGRVDLHRQHVLRRCACHDKAGRVEDGARPIVPGRRHEQSGVLVEPVRVQILLCRYLLGRGQHLVLRVLDPGIDVTGCPLSPVADDHRAAADDVELAPNPACGQSRRERLEQLHDAVAIQGPTHVAHPPGASRHLGSGSAPCRMKRRGREGDRLLHHGRRRGQDPGDLQEPLAFLQPRRRLLFVELAKVLHGRGQQRIPPGSRARRPLVQHPLLSFSPERPESSGAGRAGSPV